MVNPSEFASIQSPEALETRLLASGVDTSQWGTDRTKSVGDLWAEIVAGESRIQMQPLQRVVLGVVNVLIRRGERILIETQQVFASGLMRLRDMPPSEKMLPGESPVETAVRCLREELGVARHDIEIAAAAHPPRREVRLSPSYPGLSTAYTFYTVEAQVQGLPDGDFMTHEYDADGETWIMGHEWVWRQA